MVVPKSFREGAFSSHLAGFHKVKKVSQICKNQVTFRGKYDTISYRTKVLNRVKREGNLVTQYPPTQPVDKPSETQSGDTKKKPSPVTNWPASHPIASLVVIVRN